MQSLFKEFGIAMETSAFRTTIAEATERRCLGEQRRMTRGRCRLLLFPSMTLSLTTPRRSMPAHYLESHFEGYRFRYSSDIGILLFGWFSPSLLAGGCYSGQKANLFDSHWSNHWLTSAIIAWPIRNGGAWYEVGSATLL